MKILSRNHQTGEVVIDPGLKKTKQKTNKTKQTNKKQSKNKKRKKHDT